MWCQPTHRPHTLTIVTNYFSNSSLLCDQRHIVCSATSILMEDHPHDEIRISLERLISNKPEKISLGRTTALVKLDCRLPAHHYFLKTFSTGQGGGNPYLKLITNWEQINLTISFWILCLKFNWPSFPLSIVCKNNIEIKQVKMSDELVAVIPAPSMSATVNN